MQTCGRKYRYIYIDKLEKTVKSSNLGFGTSIHSGASAVLTAQAFGLECDPLPVFDLDWQAFTAKPVEYSSIWSEEKMRETGRRLLKLFQDDWKERGWRPVMDRNGLPVVERELKIMLPGNIRYTAIIDAVVRTRENKIIVLDFKTPSTATMEEFQGLSDQLLGNQVVVDAHRAELDIEQVDGLLFYELIKRPIPVKKLDGGPLIHVPDITPRRSDEDIADWMQELQFVADDIRRKRFFRRPMDAFSTPCDLCDFRSKCLGKATSDIVVRPPREAKSEMPAPELMAVGI